MYGLSLLVTLLLWPFAAPAQDGPGVGSGRSASKDIRTLQAASVQSGGDAGTRVHLGAALVGGIAVQVSGGPRPEPRAYFTASSLRWGTASDLAPRSGSAQPAVMIRPLSPPDMSTLPGRPQPPPKVVPPLAPATTLVGAGTKADLGSTGLAVAPRVAMAPRASGPRPTCRAESPPKSGPGRP